MAADDVPPDDMPLLRLGPDPIEAAIHGEPVDDLAVEALVRDLRAAYLPATEPTRSAALSAFAGDAAGRPLAESRPAVATVPERRARVRLGIAAVVGTLAGKVLLGGAVAAAAVGGLHAAEVVDVPVLPDVGRQRPAEPAPEADPPPVSVSTSVPEVAEDRGVVEGDGTRPTAPAGSPAPAPASPSEGGQEPPRADAPAPSDPRDSPTGPPTGDQPPAPAPAPPTPGSPPPDAEPAPEQPPAPPARSGPAPSEDEADASAGTDAEAGRQPVEPTDGDAGGERSGTP